MIIGKVSATEKSPSTCDDFAFWLTDKTILSPFDIVRVHNKLDGSETYGVVQDILHITDSPSHISSYVSSDFGDAEVPPMTKRLGLSYAKCSVIHNTNENFMPLPDGAAVYTTDEEDIQIALGLDAIPEESAIPAGLMKASNDVTVPIKYNGDFLVGPEGAHANVSGISGLATKTSYIMFLLKAIQHKLNDDVAIIIMNVKGDDLLHIHRPNQYITDEQKEEWNRLGVPCEPFKNVRYLYPFSGKKDRCYANSAISEEEVSEQFSDGIASNFIYTFEHDVTKLPMLFSSVEDPNWTIESILNYIETSPEFRDIDIMDRFHVIKHPLGGSDVYDSNGKQVGYSLPSVFGDGEDFYDMDGNPVGQSFDDSYGMSDFIGVGNGSYGYMDQEIIMGRNAWLHGDPFQKEETGLDGVDGMDSCGSGVDGFDYGEDCGGSEFE